MWYCYVKLISNGFHPETELMHDPLRIALGLSLVQNSIGECWSAVHSPRLYEAGTLNGLEHESSAKVTLRDN